MSAITQLPDRSDINQRVAAEVRALMARHQLHQEDLAAWTGLSQPQVSKRLRGTVPFTLAEVDQIAAGFGLTIGQLLGEAETPRDPDPEGLPIVVHRLGFEPRTHWLDDHRSQSVIPLHGRDPAAIAA